MNVYGEGKYEVEVYRDGFFSLPNAEMETIFSRLNYSISTVIAKERVGG